jgi:hypothetical protein
MREVVHSVLREIATLLRTGLPTGSPSVSIALLKRLAVVLLLMLVASLVVDVVTERLGFARQMIYIGAASTHVSGRDWVLAGLAAPVVEELLFRSGLRSSSMALLTLWAVLLALAFISPWRMTLLGMMAIATIAGVAYLLKKPRRQAVMKAVDGVLVRHRVLWVHLSSLLFAALHLTNWKAVGATSIGSIALVLPQGIVGYGLAYVCIRMGLKWSMLAHALFNGTLLLLMAL